MRPKLGISPERGDGTDCFTALAQPLWGRSKLLTPKVRTTVTARPFDRAKARIASTAQRPELHLSRKYTTTNIF